MDNKNLWRMYLMLVNNHTHFVSDVIYPCDKYRMLESLNRCRIPYGTGDYHHEAESIDGITGDKLQVALAGVIENEKHPPSMYELNYLAEQIQSMSVKQRSLFKKEIMRVPEATIIQAIDAAHSLLSAQSLCDCDTLNNRAVLWGKDDPYFRVLVSKEDKNCLDDETGVWINCPTIVDDFDSAAKILGVNSWKEIYINHVDGVIKCGESIELAEINHWAATMKENNIGQQLGKYKAVLELESCVDVAEAAELAGKLDYYKFFQEDELETVLGYFVEDVPMDYDEEMEEAEQLGIAITDYGIIQAKEYLLKRELERFSDEFKKLLMETINEIVENAMNNIQSHGALSSNIDFDYYLCSLGLDGEDVKILDKLFDGKLLVFLGMHPAVDYIDGNTIHFKNVEALNELGIKPVKTESDLYSYEPKIEM